MPRDGVAPMPADRARLLGHVVTFIGDLHGRPLTDTDTAELRDRLEFSIEAEPSRWLEYRQLIDWLDARCRAQGVGQYGGAGAASRARAITELMAIDPYSRTANALSRVSKRAARVYSLRRDTVHELVWLYNNSGVPWRARGYRRWPGIPGDWREVLAAGESA